MRNVKSERLKKLESELNDLEQWLKLGLVPKKDVQKHKEEIQAVKDKIAEEKERLQILRESGDAEDFVQPKRTPPRPGYTEMPTIPDIDMAETGAGFETESEFEVTHSATELSDHSEEEEEEATEKENEEEEEEEDLEEESYFSDRNRWKRGGIVDPDANEW